MNLFVLLSLCSKVSVNWPIDAQQTKNDEIMHITMIRWYTLFISDKERGAENVIRETMNLLFSVST